MLRFTLTATIALLALTCGASGAGAGAGEPKAVGGHTVLDLSRGSFRTFLHWRTPRLCDKDGKLMPLLRLKGRKQKEADRKPVKVVVAAPPPAEWKDLGFADDRWPRTRGGVYVGLWYGKNGIYNAGNPAEWDLICLRGNFEVTDPKAVGDLNLTLNYYGGAIVYLNGKEVARAHLPEGEISFDTPATHYADPAYLRPDGKQYGLREARKHPERIKLRTRRLKTGESAGVKLPAKLLRKGLNVLAVEIHTAPIRDLVFTAKMGKVNWRGRPTPWPHSGVTSATLTAASSAGLASRAGPGRKLSIYNAQPIESVNVWDYAHPAGKLRPIRMVGARNGTYSGKVVLSSAASIKNLKVTPGDLKLPEGKGLISTSDIKVRWAEPATRKFGWNSDQRFERLLEKMPAEIPPLKISIRRRKVQPEAAAVVPVWISVKVPADAKPGSYKGSLKIQASGEKFEVPVELLVHDWRVPDPKDFQQRYNVYQSPESVAIHYKVELWSDKHFELIGKSFKVLGEIGSKILVLNLVVGAPSLGNKQSMVRWIKEADGSYKHDFSIIDKYIAAYEKNAGTPAIVQINCWGHYKEKDKSKAKPLHVTVYDPKTKQLSTMPQPAYATPESEKFWQPVFDGLKERVEKKKWYQQTAVCYTSYCWAPPRVMVDSYKKIWPDGKWMNCSHSNPRAYKGSKVSMPVPYSEWVWGCGGLYNPDARGRSKYFPRPWQKGKGRIEVGNPRYGVGFIRVLRDYSPLVAWRFVAEGAMQGNLRGLGRVGGDFWPILVGDKRKKWVPMCTSYAAVGPVNNSMAILSPGPDGAIFSERLEMFREGVQATEAIAFLQKAIVDKQIDAATAARIEKHLDERARYFLRTLRGQGANWMSLECSDWQKRDQELYTLCAEVAAKK
jgi:Glycoside hydrolase 123, catalytic domain/Glycoside hydrolase 123 N-terminal domain